MQRDENETIVKFHIFDLNFTPYKDDRYSSMQILRDCIKRITDERLQKQKAIVIDRHEGRTDELPRNIFVSSAARKLEDGVYKCKMALIRDNKIPTLVNKSTFTLTPIDELGDNAIAETTNFYIDVNHAKPIVCCEFNSQGPRVSDIEYYFRYISSHKMLMISKACKASLHMKLSVKEVLESLSDVLGFRIKARPDRIKYLHDGVEEAFFTNMRALAETVAPTSIRVDAFFRSRGSKKEPTKSKNNGAIAFIKRVLKAIDEDNDIAEDFEDFRLEFEREDGSDEVFNLIRGKQEIQVNCPYISPGNLDPKELYRLAINDFKKYLEERNEE